MGLDFNKIEENINTAVPIVYPPTEKDKEQAIFYLKPLTPKQADTIRKRYTKTDYKRNTAREITNDEKVMQDTIDKAIVNWEGIYRGEEKLECTKKEKIWLIENAADVAEWIIEELLTLSRVAERTKEAEIKN